MRLIVAVFVINFKRKQFHLPLIPGQETGNNRNFLEFSLIEVFTYTWALCIAQKPFQISNFDLAVLKGDLQLVFS